MVMARTFALTVALAMSLPPDLIWYELGRRRGSLVSTDLVSLPTP
jgi:hypothetical protein